MGRRSRPVTGCILTDWSAQRQLDAKGLIYKDRHSGWYSVSDECFYPQIQTTTTVDAAGQEQRISTESGSTVEWQEEENYKFRLSEFQHILEAHYAKHTDAICPPQHHEAILHQLRTTPLQDLSVSRPSSRLSWGIPVPDDETHTIYVWIDALTVYLSYIGFPWPNREAMLASGWPSDVQVIGKDILRRVLSLRPVRSGN